MPSSDRPRVGYVLKMYPRFSETFIVTEVLAHEAAGLDPDIFSLRLPVDGRFHEALARIRAPVTYFPPEGLKAADFWQTLGRVGRKHPRIWEPLRSAGDEEAAEVHQAVLVAEAALARGLTHLHAHFATSAATVAMHAARMAGITFSFTAHAKDIYFEGVDQGRLRRKLREASSVITVSDYNLRYLRATYGEDAARVRRVYNGLDLGEFTYSPPLQRPPVIVGVGRLVEKKGFSDLVEACGVLRDRGADFRCEIIGDGPLAPALAAQVRTLGLQDRVSLLGARPRGEVIGHMRSAALLAAPCVVGEDGNRDGLPTVLLEAMALGTPCISTHVTGIPEVVRHMDTGVCVPEHDPAALATAMGLLLIAPDLRCGLASRARVLIEQDFDIHRNCEQIREAFAPARAEAELAVQR